MRRLAILLALLGVLRASFAAPAINTPSLTPAAGGGIVRLNLGPGDEPEAAIGGLPTNANGGGMATGAIGGQSEGAIGGMQASGGGGMSSSSGGYSSMGGGYSASSSSSSMGGGGGGGGGGSGQQTIQLGDGTVIAASFGRQLETFYRHFYIYSCRRANQRKVGGAAAACARRTLAIAAVHDSRGDTIHVTVREYSIDQLPTQFQATYYVNFINSLSQADREQVMAILTRQAPTNDILRALELWLSKSSADVRNKYTTIVSSVIGDGQTSNTAVGGGQATIGGGQATNAAVGGGSQTSYGAVGSGQTSNGAVGSGQASNAAVDAGRDATITTPTGSPGAQNAAGAKTQTPAGFKSLAVAGVNYIVPAFLLAPQYRAVLVTLTATQLALLQDVGQQQPIDINGLLALLRQRIVIGSPQNQDVEVLIDRLSNVANQYTGGPITINGGGVDGGIGYLNGDLPSGANGGSGTIYGYGGSANGGGVNGGGIGYGGSLPGGVNGGITINGNGGLPDGSITINGNGGLPGGVNGGVVNGGGIGYGNGGLPSGANGGLGVITIGGQQFSLPAFLLDARYAPLLSSLTPDQAQLLQALAANGANTLDILITLLRQRGQNADAQTRNAIEILIERLLAASGMNVGGGVNGGGVNGGGVNGGGVNGGGIGYGNGGANGGGIGYGNGGANGGGIGYGNGGLPSGANGGLGVITIGGQQFSLPAFLLDARYAPLLSTLTPDQAQLLQALAANGANTLDILITLLRQRGQNADAQTRNAIEILIERLLAASGMNVGGGGVVIGGGGVGGVGGVGGGGGVVIGGGGGSGSCAGSHTYGGNYRPLYRAYSQTFSQHVNFKSLATCRPMTARFSSTRATQARQQLKPPLTRTKGSSVGVRVPPSPRPAIH